MASNLHCGCDRCRGRELKPLSTESTGHNSLPGREHFIFEEDEWIDDLEEYFDEEEDE